MAFRMLGPALMALIAGTCTAAQAAERDAILLDVIGSAFIKSVGGATVAKAGDIAPVGSQIVVGLETLAALDVGGCSVFLAPSTSYTVPHVAPCEAGQMLHIGALGIRGANNTNHVDFGGGGNTSPTYDLLGNIIIGTASTMIVGIVATNTIFEKDQVSPNGVHPAP